MRNIKSFLMLFVVAFTAVMVPPIKSQTNAWTTFTQTNILDFNRNVVGKHIKATFTMDSLGVVLLSEPIDLADFVNVDMETYPATFRFKTVSTYDSSSTQIRLLAYYQGSAAGDSVFAIDTLRDWGATGVTAGQVETDSLGQLTFNKLTAPKVRVAVGCLRSDVNSGTLDIIFRKPKIN